METGFGGTWRLAWIAAVSIILSLLIAIFVHENKTGATYPVVYVILEHLATVLFILGIWHAIDQLWVTGQMKREILKLIKHNNKLIVTNFNAQFDVIKNTLDDLPLITQSDALDPVNVKVVVA